MLDRLRLSLAAAPRGMAVVIPDDAMAVLDNQRFREAVNLINGATCQVICMIAHRFDPTDFPAARVHACTTEQTIELRKTGA